MMQKRRVILFFLLAMFGGWILFSTVPSDDAKMRWLAKCAKETGGSVVKESYESRRTAASRGNGFDYYVQLKDGSRVNYGESYENTQDRFPLP